jgi:hypothetical protein
MKDSPPRRSGADCGYPRTACVASASGQLRGEGIVIVNYRGLLPLGEK